MFSDEEMAKLESLVGPETSIEDVAKAMGMHRTTVERKLTKYHGVVLEPTRGSRLTPVAEYSARKAQEKKA